MSLNYEYNNSNCCLFDKSLLKEMCKKIQHKFRVLKVFIELVLKDMSFIYNITSVQGYSLNDPKIL